jgi:putative nucleotidyltransferase with HDIG domain
MRSSDTIGRMTVPGRVDAAALLLSLDPPDWHVRHSRAVAEVASWLAERCLAGGEEIDALLAETGALLHDVDKALPAVDPLRRLPHGERSAAWLKQRGHEELADVVASHPVTRLLDGAWFERWIATSSLEARIVAYADKRAGQELESMDDRFASWARRYPKAWSDEETRAVRARADILEADVCAAARIAPGDVARNPWTEAAFHDATTPARAST